MNQNNYEVLPCNVGDLTFVKDSSIARSVKRKVYHDMGLEFLMRKYKSRLFPFFDVGANVGLFSILAMQLSNGLSFSKTMIHAFEPAVDNLEALEKNLQAHGAKDDVAVVPFACSFRRDSIKMGIIDCGLSLKSKKNVSEFRTLPLHDYIAEHDCKPSFIKVDVEGSEFDVLDGISMKHLKDCLLEMEFSYRDHRDKIPKIQDLFPTETHKVEILLSLTEVKIISDKNIPIDLTEIHHEDSGQKLFSVIISSESEFHNVMELLKESTIERGSRKWEIIFTPKTSTIGNRDLRVPGFATRSVLATELAPKS